MTCKDKATRSSAGNQVKTKSRETKLEKKIEHREYADNYFIFFLRCMYNMNYCYVDLRRYVCQTST